MRTTIDDARKSARSAVAGRKQSRSWILTLPAEEYDETFVEQQLANYAYIGQLERGKDRNDKNPEGYLHWQVYIENKTPISFGTLRNKFPKGHFEVRYGTKQDAFDYVTKEDTAQGVLISNGDIDLSESGKGARNDLTQIKFEVGLNNKTANQLLVEDKINSVQQLRFAEAYETAVRAERYGKVLRDVKASYLFGASGVGKTFSLWERFGSDAYIVSDYAHPFDEYEGQRVLVFDDFYSALDLPFMLRLLDPYPLVLPARFHNRVACFDEVWITSNVPPEKQYVRERSETPEVGAAFDRRIRTGGVFRMVERGELEEVSE